MTLEHTVMLNSVTLAILALTVCIHLLSHR